MGLGKKNSRAVDKMTGQKKNNYQVIEPGKKSTEKIPKCACDKKRCLNGRCGVCWMLILGVSIAAIVAVILYFTDTLDFDFETSGTDTLYEEICTDCTDEPTSTPTIAPTGDPTIEPTGAPSDTPTLAPTSDPSVEPTSAPSETPTLDPTSDPTTLIPTASPTYSPSEDPTSDPTLDPTGTPTLEPSGVPSVEPTYDPSSSPTVDPTSSPTEPTEEPTSDPTSERRRNYVEDMVANVLFVTVDGTTFDYAVFETPEVDEFLTEGYTFNNLKHTTSLSSLVTGRNLLSQPTPFNPSNLPDGVMTWAELIRTKGYKNYYYGNWIYNSEPLNRGWDVFFGTAHDSDMTDLKHNIMEKVQSRLHMIKDDKWSIAVNWTAPLVRTKVKNFPDSEACSQYFKIGGASFDYQRGAKCQWTVEFDTRFGKLMNTLKSTGLWSKTIVLFVIGGQKNSIFSINGGALPAIYLNRTDGDVHSMLDAVPTILAVGGLSDLEIATAKLDGFPIFGMDQNKIKDHRDE